MKNKLLRLKHLPMFARDPLCCKEVFALSYPQGEGIL